MRRREFITLLGGAMAAPTGARAQQTMRRIGALMSYAESDSEGQARLAAFRDGLRKLNWIEGGNLQIDTRWATQNSATIQQAARELIAAQPELVLSATTPTTAALLKQTRTTPIVFANVSDPVGSGFVASLARPGGNTTGFINLEASIAGKWLELLREIAPGIERAGLLFNPATAPYAEYYLGPFKAAGRSLGVAGVAVPVTDAPSLESAMAQSQESKTGLVVLPDSFTTGHRSDIIALAARHHVPAIYPYRFFPEIGGLLSYGNDQLDNFRRAAAYVDRVLKGEKVGELPVQVPAKFELVINLKTARALGLDVPLLLQQRADAVIE